MSGVLPAPRAAHAAVVVGQGSGTGDSRDTGGKLLVLGGQSFDVARCTCAALDLGILSCWHAVHTL